MSPAIHSLIPILAFCALANLAGCGGGGGGSDDAPPPAPVDPVQPIPDPIPEPPAPDPYSIDSYAEYTEGTSLSGIWMMIINAEYDVDNADDASHASETVRSVVFIKENTSGSYSGLSVSNPVCAPFSLGDVQTTYSGNNVNIRTGYVDFDLTVNTYSRMSGIVENLEEDGAETNVQLVKVAPLPLGNWGNFVPDTPDIGDVTGVVQSDATTDAFEFDDGVDCFMQSHGNGGYYFAAYLFNPPAGPDYESIVVSTDSGDNLIFTQSAGRLEYSKLSDYGNYYSYSGFTNRTNRFSMSAEGTNPVTITISADASNDASSDGAELDIEIGF